METTTGNLCWFDIPVSNFEKSISFYGEIFNWSFIPMGDDYRLIQVGDKMIGGLRKAKAEKRVEADYPVLYFVVEDMDATAERVTSLGGKLIGEKVLINEGEDGCHYYFSDLDQNIISLWAQCEPKPN